MQDTDAGVETGRFLFHPNDGVLHQVREEGQAGGGSAELTNPPWLDGDKDCFERVQKRAVGMISGLAGRTYEDRLKELWIVTLEERRHQMDMLQTYKILSRKEKVDPICWFTMASDSERVTRQSADPLNIRPGAPRLDIKRYFYSQRVVDSWTA
jgi:hypothetical protein